MRYVLIALGILTILMAGVLAVEGQWWIAVPDGIFGAGVAWMAWQSLKSDHHPAQQSHPKAA